MEIDDAKEIEALRIQIQKNHGLPVADDDPLLVFATANLALMRSFANHLEEMEGSFRRDLEEIAVLTKQRAEAIVNGSIEAANQLFLRHSDHAAKAIALAVEERIKDAGGDAKTTNRTGMLALFASLLAVVSSFLTLLFGMHWR